MDVTQFTMSKDPMMVLVKRSVFFGLMAIVAGIIATYIINMIPISDFKVKYITEITLFLTGFILFFGIHYLKVMY
jgi:hypothetical protein